MRNRNPKKLLLTLSLAALLPAAGCSSGKPTTKLTPNSFHDRAGLKVADSSPATRPAPIAAAVLATPPLAIAPVTVGVSLGQYQTLGGVVAEVNGYPIFANKVFRQLKPELSARALEMDETQYRNFVSQEIAKKIAGLERDELVFGAADRSLVGDDRKMASYLTMQWRTRQITEAGGSSELAQRKATADGNNFDELVFDQYRRYMTEVFYRRKVVPRVQITADDMRASYEMTRDKDFTEHDEIRFRLIKVLTRSWGSKDAARKQAETILEQLKTKDFAEVARTSNDDARLARSGGEEIPVQRGAYSLEKVEAALWETKPGGITPIIEDWAGFYIAKVESRKDGKTQAFEDHLVQDKIYKALWARQFRALTDDIEQTLRRNSMVRDGKDMTQTAIDMAMQQYPTWSKGQ